MSGAKAELEKELPPNSHRTNSSLGHDVLKFCHVSRTHPPCGITLPLCSSFYANCPALQLTTYFCSFAPTSEKGNEDYESIVNRALPSFCTSREILCERDQAPDYYIRHVLVFFSFYSRTCRNSIIPELLQSATGMYNFSCAHTMENSRAFPAVYYSLANTLSAIFTNNNRSWFHPRSPRGTVANERLYAVNYIYCIFAAYTSAAYLFSNCAL